jgi:hypothetical protein
VSKLVGNIAALSKQKMVPASIVDVLNDRCTVRLSSRGSILHNLKFFGPTPKAGDTVYVDYRTGSPVVQTSGAIAADLSATPTVATQGKSLGTSSSPYHNDLPGLQGGAVATEADPAEYYHLTYAEYLLIGSSGGIEEAPDDGLYYVRRNETWEEMPASSGGCDKWDPLSPPRTPNAMDDEFDDETFDTSKWTVMDAYAYGTITEDEVGLKMSTTGYNIMVSVTQPIPTGDYTVWTRLSLRGGIYDGWGNCGICFQEDMASDDIYTVGPQIVGANDHGDVPITTGYWTSAEAYTDPGTWGKYYPMSLWIRVRVDVSEQIYYTDLSLDGLSWQCCGSDTLIYAPTRVGLFFTSADGTDRVIYSFFRVTDSIDPFQDMCGRSWRTLVAS